MSDFPPASDRIMRLITGYWATGLLGTAARFSVFTHLEEQPLDAAELAARAGIAERGAQALLDGLTGLGLLTTDGVRHRNTAEASAFLVDGKPTSLTGFAQVKAGHMAALGGLADVVRAGGPLSGAVVEVVDNPHWENLVQALAAQAVPVARLVAEELKLAEAGEVSILDVGGGSGVCSAVWLGLNPAARSTQLDWAPINAIARRLLTEQGVGERVAFVDGDFHTTGFGTAVHDLVMYSNIAHQEGSEENMAVFAKARGALRDGGTLVVSDYVVDDDRGGPAFALTFAAEMLLKSRGGSTWRRADYREWLRGSGFEEVTFLETASPTTLVFAK